MKLTINSLTWQDFSYNSPDFPDFWSIPTLTNVKYPNI